MSAPHPLRHRSTRSVDAALAAQGLIGRVVELPDSTRTAVDAARAIGCEVRQIVKSLVFQGRTSRRPILVLASGAHRVHEDFIAEFVGEPLDRADPEFARSAAGYAIGGVPPIGHPSPLPTFVDYDLIEQRELWAAAGHPNAVCRLTSTELLHITRGTPIPAVPTKPEVSLAGPWITFDCYGTLIDWRAGLLEELTRVVGPLPAEASDRWFQRYLHEEQRLEAGPYTSYRDIVAQATRAASAAIGKSIREEDALHFPSSIPGWPPFPDTLRSLERLQAMGFRTAILSNIDRDLLSSTLERSSVAVDMTVAAEDVQSYKPELAHWIRFLKATGVRPSTCLHAAGGYEYNLPPASLLGFQTAYVARYAGSFPTPAAGSVVGNLTELVDRLANTFRARGNSGESKLTS